MSDIVIGKVVPLKTDWTPSELAYRKLLELSSRGDLQTIHRFGGPLTAEEVAANHRILKKRFRTRVKIIAEHEVFDEYLKPLYEQQKHLCDEIERVQLHIAALEMLRKKKAKAAK